MWNSLAGINELVAKKSQAAACPVCASEFVDAKWMHELSSVEINEEISNLKERDSVGRSMVEF
jgi:hypothetical protein